MYSGFMQKERGGIFPLTQVVLGGSTTITIAINSILIVNAIMIVNPS